MVQDALLVAHGEAIEVPLIESLEREGYDVSRASTGAEAIVRVEWNSPAVVLVSVELPDIEGLEVCRVLRRGGYRGGLVMIASRASELDLVVGLDAGADDYVVAPLSLGELQARVRALVRRHAWNRAHNPSAVTTPHGLHVDPATRTVECRSATIRLTPKEFDLLTALVRHIDEIVPRGTLMDEVWDEQWTGSGKVLDVTIGHLRTKLHDAGVVEPITAVRGVGFRLGS